MDWSQSEREKVDPEQPSFAAYHRIYSRADAHVGSHRSADVIVGSILEATLEDEKAFSIGHRELVDEVLNGDRGVKHTFAIFKTWNIILSWHPSPLPWEKLHI